MRLAAPLALLATMALLPAPALGQALTAHDSVVAPISALFNGMRTRDTALMRSAFAPGALLAQPTRPGQPLKWETVDAFLAAVAGAPAGPAWDEQIYDPEVRIDGQLATVWTFYTFKAGTYSHCGVDAVHLVRAASGWKISTLSDTRRQADCSTEGKKRVGG